MSKQLRAFTIMELLVVLVITSIVLYLGFLVIQTSNLQLNSFQSYFQKQRDEDLLYFQLNELFDQSETIQLKQNQLKFTREEHRAILEQNDTSLIITGFLGDETNYTIAGAKFSVKESEQLVEQLSITFQNRSKNQPTKWNFSKEYDFVTLYENRIR